MLRFSSLDYANRRIVVPFLTCGLLSVFPGAIHSQQAPVQPEPLSLRLVQDSVRAQRDESTVEATVEFVVHNRSEKVIYDVNECGRSPRYWVERRQIDAAGNETWHQVFSADCIGQEPPRRLLPSDSMVFTSRFVQFPGQGSDFAFSNHIDVYRVNYVISTAPNKPELRIISPAFVVRPPE